MTAATVGRALERRTTVLAAGLAVAALLAVMAVALARGRSAEDASTAAPGVAAEFTLPQLQGGTFTLSEHADGPVFVYFWASWCAPCVVEAPVIQRLYPEYRAKGYTFVGVNIWDAEADARRFADAQQVTFPLVADPGGKTYLAYGVQQLPSAFFLRPGLQTDRKYIGAMTEAQLREMLDHAGGA